MLRLESQAAKSSQLLSALAGRPKLLPSRFGSAAICSLKVASSASSWTGRWKVPLFSRALTISRRAWGTPKASACCWKSRMSMSMASKPNDSASSMSSLGRPERGRPIVLRLRNMRTLTPRAGAPGWNLVDGEV